ncbi:MAG: hypothetical protein M3Z35_01150 [Nitrospirota bacterium]|nr:hypothetical protein [Nitrospirota bacterium]
MRPADARTFVQSSGDLALVVADAGGPTGEGPGSQPERKARTEQVPAVKKEAPRPLRGRGILAEVPILAALALRKGAVEVSQAARARVAQIADPVQEAWAVVQGWVTQDDDVRLSLSGSFLHRTVELNAPVVDRRKSLRS